MSAPLVVNPLLSFSWQDDGEALAMTASDSATGRDERLDAGELWLVDAVARCLSEPRERDVLIADAADRYALSPEQAAATLDRMTPLLFLPDGHPGRDLERAAPLWERNGWKLALEYYAGSISGSDTSAVAVPVEPPPAPLSAVVGRRRTCRDFDGASLDVADVSFILDQAFTGAVPPHLQCHAIVMRVNGLASGVYRRLPGVLEPIRLDTAERLEEELIELLIGQTYVAGSAVAILLSIDFASLASEDRSPSRYRTCLVQCGMLAQRLILLGHTCHIESFLSAAIREECAARTTREPAGSTVAAVHTVVFGRAARDVETVLRGEGSRGAEQ